MKWALAVVVAVLHIGAAISYALEGDVSTVIWVGVATVWFVNYAVAVNTAGKWESAAESWERTANLWRGVRR